jgi:hypothetical protein
LCRSIDNKDQKEPPTFLVFTEGEVLYVLAMGRTALQVEPKEAQVFNGESETPDGGQ